MIKARVVVGVCALCALALGVVAVQTAAAATKGTTGFTCKEKKEPGGVGFSKAHCTAADAVATGAKYEHVPITQGGTTEGRLTSVDTAGNPITAKLKSVQSGVTMELQANLVHGEASGLNATSASGEHYIEGTGKTTFTEVAVTAPAGKGCKVNGGQISTNEMKGTSLGQGMEGLLEPASGTAFAEFTIEGCSGSKALESLNHIYQVSGSIKASGDGATAEYTHAGTTAQGTLKVSGQLAGMEVATTVTGRKNSTEPFTPLAVTTVETP